MPKRVDANQRDIVQAIRQYGARVLPIHELGKGAPDLLVGYKGKNLLIEVKDGAKSPSRRKLTEDEQVWHELWKGQVAVITSVAEAIALLENA